MDILLYIHLKPHDQRASVSVPGGAAIQPPEHVRLWPHRHVAPRLVGDLLAGAESSTREEKSEEAYSCHFLGQYYLFIFLLIRKLIISIATGE